MTSLHIELILKLYSASVLENTSFTIYLRLHKTFVLKTFVDNVATQAIEASLLDDLI